MKISAFSANKILREINSREAKSSKLPLWHFWRLWTLVFYESLHCLKAKIYQTNKMQSLQNGKIAVLELLHSSRLISRIIRDTETSWNFHTVWGKSDFFRQIVQNFSNLPTANCSITLGSRYDIFAFKWKSVILLVNSGQNSRQNDFSFQTFFRLLLLFWFWKNVDVLSHPWTK